MVSTCFCSRLFHGLVNRTSPVNRKIWAFSELRSIRDTLLLFRNGMFEMSDSGIMGDSD